MREAENAFVHYASAGQLEIVMAIWLRRHVPTVDCQGDTGWTALLAAVGSEHFHVAEFLLAQNASTESRTPQSCTALHLAAAKGNVEMIELLCQSKADVNAHGVGGKTALHFAQIDRLPHVVSCLLDHGASPDEVDDGGYTVLAQACLIGDHDFVAYFLEKLDDARKTEAKRAVMNKPRTADNATPLHVAAERAHVRVVKALVRHDAELEAKNANGDSPLSTATKEGHKAVVGILLASNADIETTDRAGFTPLMIATCKGLASVVDLLLEHGANVNHTNIHSGTALHYAAEKGRAGIVKSLLEHGAATEAQHESGSTPLLAAVDKGHLEVAQLLINYGADVNGQVMTTAFTSALQDFPVGVAEMLLKGDASTESRTPRSFTLLHLAAAKGNVEMIELLCQSKADINAHGVDGKTALHMALKAESKRAVLCLLDHGASASAVDAEGWSVLLQACSMGDENAVFQILNRLDKAGERDVKQKLVNNPRTLDKWTPLLEAADLGHLSLVKLLVRHGAKLETKNANDYSPLNHATSKGHKDVVEFLLASGADKETTNAGASTPLLIASNRGFTAIVALLLDLHANVDHRDIHGSSVLFNAAMWGRIAIVESLLNITADPDIRTNTGWTPLLVAAQNGHVKVARVLIDHGADVNCQGYDHWTPLAVAVQNGHTAVCKLLLKRRASTALQTTEGQTALHLAAACDHRKIIDLLVDKRADPCARDSHGRTPADVAIMEGHFTTAARLDQPVEANEEAIGDHVWPRHSLLELYGRGDNTTSERRAKNPPWYIDRASIEAIQECAHLTTPSTAVSVGTWLGASVVIAEPTIIAVFEQLDGDMHMRLKRLFREEVSKLYPLRHPHVIRLYGASHRDENLFLVMEHPQNGTLRSSVGEHKHRVWTLLHQVALGVQYLHERGIVHGNLMGDHILLGADGQAKLTGFGVYLTSLNSSLNRVWNAPQTTDPRNPLFDNDLHAHGQRLIKELSEKLPHARPLEGDFTRVWDAPEVVLGQDATVESDIYSLAMCVVETVSGQSPYALEAWTKQDLKELIIGGVPPRQPAAFNARGWELVEKMVCFEPLKRLKISAVVRELAALASDEAMGVQSNATNRNSAAWTGDSDSDLEDAATVLGEHADESPQRQVLCRLHDMWQAVGQLPPVTRERAQALLQDIRARFTNDRKAHAAMGDAASFAAQRQQADRLFAFHNEIDRVLEQHSSQLPAEATRPAIHAWRDRWYAHRRAQLQALGASLDHVHELDIETATCLLFELTRRRDAYTSIAPADIHAACRAMRLMPGVRVPDWFIPHYEVAFDASQEFSRGGFGSVHHGEWMGSRVVVKRVFADDNTEFEKEVEIWSQLYHPHVLQLFGACHVGQKFLVSEFAEGGQLDRYLYTLKTKPAKRNREVWRTLYEAALGLQYLHARGVVHCDLKCNNILVGGDTKAKVSDYGLSRTKQQQPPDAETEADTTSLTPALPNATGVGAPPWKAPEVLNGATPTFASDVYSLAMCVVEAVTGELPWVGHKDEVVSDHVRVGKLFEKPSGFSDVQWALVVGACHFDPKKRLPLSEITTQLKAFANEANESHGDADTHELDDLAEPEPERTVGWTDSAAFSEVALPNASYCDSW